MTTIETTTARSRTAGWLATVTLLVALFGVLLGVSPADAAPAKAPKPPATYSAFGETNVSAHEHNSINVYCNPGDAVKSFTVITKVKKYEAARFQFTNGAVQGGVWVEFTGNAKREETLSVRVTCKRP